MKKQKKITALVTAVGGRSVGYQIFECLKFFRDDYRLIVTDADAFSPGLYEADKAYLLPSVKSPEFISKLFKICKQENIDVVLPGSLPEIAVIAQHKNQFLKKGVVPITNSYNLIKQAMDKLALYKLLKEKNILMPTTIELNILEEARKLKFPIIIKPRHGSSGSRNVHIVQDLEELEMFLKILKKEKIRLLGQEYIGSEDEEYTVGIVIGRDGKIIDTIVMRRYLTGLSRGETRTIKNKDYVLSTGYSQGFFVNQPDVKDYCEYVAKIVGAIGPLNIQCRRGEKGVYILEVHPRFSGSASMRAEMGFNEPHILIRNFLGLEKIDKIPHRLGCAVIRKFTNTVVKIEKYNKMKKMT